MVCRRGERVSPLRRSIGDAKKVDAYRERDQANVRSPDSRGSSQRHETESAGRGRFPVQMPVLVQTLDSHPAKT
jgi:hypothetical protein